MSEFLKPVIKGFVDVLYPLRKGLSSAENFELLLARYGWDAQINSNQMEVIKAAFAVEPVFVSIFDKLDKFINGVKSDKAEASLELILEVKNAVDKLGKLSSSSAGLPFPLDQPSFWNELSADLFSDLFAHYLEKRQPVIYAIFHISGIITYEKKNPSGSNRIPYTQTKLDFGKLGDFFTSPYELFKDIYKWDVPGEDFDHYKLLRTLERILLAFEVPATVKLPRQSAASKYLDVYEIEPQNIRELEIPIVDSISPTDDSYWKMGMVMLPIPDPEQSSAKVKGIAILPLLQGGVSKNLYFSKELYLRITGAFDADQAISLQIYADKVGIDSSLSDLEFKAAFDLIGDPEEPWILLGAPESSRLELGGFKVSFAVRGNMSNPETIFSIGTGDNTTNQNPRLSFVFDSSGGDGFINEILGENDFTIDFQSNLTWSSTSGLAFEGQAGFEIALPIHQGLGPIEITTLYLALKGGYSGDKPNAKGDLGIGVKGELGPVSFVVENIGTSLSLKNTDNSSEQGILGEHDLVFGFKPPNGVGLSVDAGAVKGGGYLFFDFDREEYAGALELVFSEWITLKAIGLITTKMPDGSKGFSMLIIITVEFGTGIQLGFGFTLNGVGGLLGINRIVSIEPLKDGIRTGAVESIMFPQNVVENAPRIISDLRKFFPPQNDAFLVGPMAKIGWGTPTLIDISIGIVLEFPSVDITILGVVKVVLPDEKADVLRLQVNFIGRIEPSNERLWFYAELFDSRVLFITLEGGMGLLVSWGDNANFVVSAGGFHPRFSPPPLPFPEPARIAAMILNEPNARVRIEAYFAVTSNTVQFGARAELYFGLSDFKIEGFLAFDALFQFDPFFFRFSLSISLSVKVFGVGMFSVGFSGILEGPTPWYIEGKGKISLLFFKIKVPFSHTWGNEEDTKLDPIAVFPLIEKELNALTNWEARLPESSSTLVSLRELGESEEDQLVLHPVGTLRISQRKVPLNFNIDKVGNQRPSDVKKLEVEAAVNGGGNMAVSDIEEQFAIGQYKDLDDSGRLSSAAFEPLDGGVEVAVEGEQIKTSQAVKRVIRYESIIIDSYYKRFVKPFYSFFANGFSLLYETLYEHFLAGSAVHKSVLSNQHKKRMQPFDEVIEVKPNEYSVAFNTDNKPVGENGTVKSFTSQAKAKEFMEQKNQEDPKFADQLHVIPNTEINTAA